MVLPDLMKIKGENATMTVEGLDILVDGDIELNVEREIIEWKARGVAATQHIPSGRQTITGSISGVPTSTVSAVLRQYLGIDSLDGTVNLTDVDLKSVTITFTWTDESDKVTLSQVYLKNLKVSAKDGEVIRIESDFVANKIDIV